MSLKILLIITAFLPFFCSAQTTSDSTYNHRESFYVPVTPTEMRILYLSAKSRNDGYSLSSLAKVQNENLFLNDIKAWNILEDAYNIGVANQDPELLYLIAVYENATNLIKLKAGDILYEAYRAAMLKNNVFLLFKIATYEHIENLMDAQAGDILYDAYRTALAIKDVSILYKIAKYEQQQHVMKIAPEEILKEISKLKF